jgi:hypothetical protein
MCAVSARSAPARWPPVGPSCGGFWPFGTPPTRRLVSSTFYGRGRALMPRSGPRSVFLLPFLLGLPLRPAPGRRGRRRSPATLLSPWPANLAGPWGLRGVRPRFVLLRRPRNRLATPYHLLRRNGLSSSFLPGSVTLGSEGPSWRRAAPAAGFRSTRSTQASLSRVAVRSIVHPPAADRSSARCSSSSQSIGDSLPPPEEEWAIEQLSAWFSDTGL